MKDRYLEKTVASTFGSQPMDLPVRPYLAQPPKPPYPYANIHPSHWNIDGKKKGGKLGEENWINKPLREQGRPQPCKRIQFFSDGNLSACMHLLNTYFLCKKSYYEYEYDWIKVSVIG